MTSFSPLQDSLRPGLKPLGGDAQSRDPFIIERAVPIGDIGFHAQEPLKMSKAVAIDLRAVTGSCEASDGLCVILSTRPIRPQPQKDRIAI